MRFDPLKKSRNRKVIIILAIVFKLFIISQNPYLNNNNLSMIDSSAISAVNIKAGQETTIYVHFFINYDSYRIHSWYYTLNMLNKEVKVLILQTKYREGSLENYEYLTIPININFPSSGLWLFIVNDYAYEIKVSS